MQFIEHRINSLEKLKSVDINHGAEIDIRYHEDELILHHDPFGHQKNTDLITLKSFLKNYKLQGPLILNVKTEGIEKHCIDLMNEYKVENWFFLDLSMPFFVKYARHAKAGDIKGFSSKNLAVRFSEFEAIEYALKFEDHAKWVWVDCFTKLPLDSNVYNLLHKKFNLCLVSPELQGHSLERIEEFKRQISNFEIAAVCSKRVDLWK